MGYIFLKMVIYIWNFSHKIFSLEKYIFNVRKWNSLELNGRKEIHTAYPVGNFSGIYSIVKWPSYNWLSFLKEK